MSLLSTIICPFRVLVCVSTLPLGGKREREDAVFSTVLIGRFTRNLG